ncbi:hypothetical protein [Clostridium botulinum]|uniref:hypothetical protein n=1 Tax=Clostridium botulinum TaxID=1491 RepID=UPI001C9AE441|nr:hypothetical protein [Clostridium botulinum]MBY6809011.1 hypothetical protein [Clostridium botulinum]MBY6822284.1 hypothetical protein [Clostridium botulinum]MBY6832926.1 hypothetical protein [Clostridium botulinum]MBY6972154.1 hypothetical protein [Clostridium botulinum]HBJ1649389.1 hypothetical protein [Clostridium botulinum]
MCKIKYLGMKELIRKECERVTLKCLELGDIDLAQEVTAVLDSLDQEKREAEWSKMKQAYNDFLEYNEMCTDMLEVNYIPISTSDFKDLLEDVEIKELSSTQNGFYIRDNLNREFNIEAC